ncbi:hypothetical protein LY78DRAFT_578590 [Colletotrichum sublineola]|nr:hypothetical protein LY78DRAFT_578590 [Colletotrichum sublineola]
MVVLRCASPIALPRLCFDERSPELFCILQIVAYSIQRFFAAQVGLPWIDSRVEEHFHYSQMTIVDGVQQWCVLVIVHTVQVAAGVDKELHDILVTINRSDLQWRVASVVGYVEVFGSLAQSLLSEVVFASGTCSGKERLPVCVEVFLVRCNLCGRHV